MELPQGVIGKYKISRLICGANPFSHTAHSGALIYVGRLFAAYLTHDKIVETLSLCEYNGINTLIARADNNVVEFLGKYEKRHGKRIQWIAQTAPERTPVEDNIQFVADNGAIGCFIQGGQAGKLFSEGKIDDILKYVSLIKEKGMIAGVGAHDPRVITTAENAGAETDFYFLTINNVGYQCDDPKLASKTMKTIDKPFIGFKVLGAGRTHPKDGFQFAVDSGADFLAVGMFDFQVLENIEVAKAVFRGLRQ
jgi:hypothetical protein